MSPDHAPDPMSGLNLVLLMLGYMYYCTLDYE